MRTTSIGLDPESEANLKALVAREERSQSSIVRRLLRQAMCEKRQEQGEAEEPAPSREPAQ